MMEKPIKMDDLVVPLFLETPILADFVKGLALNTRSELNEPRLFPEIFWNEKVSPVKMMDFLK